MPETHYLTMPSDERWEHIRLGLGFILLHPDTIEEHQIAVEAYLGLKAEYERLYWFFKMVDTGGPDMSDLDAAVYGDARGASHWLEGVVVMAANNPETTHV